MSVRVRTESEVESKALAGSGSLTLGRPISFGQKDQSIASTDAFLAAIGAEIAATFLRVSRAEGIVHFSTEALVRTFVENPLATIGARGEAGKPHFERIEVVLYVTSDYQQTVLEPLLTEALNRCTIFQTICRGSHINCRLESN